MLLSANFLCQVLVFNLGTGLSLPVIAGALLGVMLPLGVIFPAQGFSAAKDLQLGPVAAPVLAVSVLTALASLAPNSLLGTLSLGLHPPDPQWISFTRDNQDHTLPGLLLTVAAGVVFAPIAEEIVFRGLIQRLASRTWGPVPAVAVSSLLFGLIHGQPWFLFGLIGVGLVLGFIFETTRSLRACILAHAVHNGVSLALDFKGGYDYADPPALTAGDWIWAGGSLVVLIALGWILRAMTAPRLD